MKDKKFSKVIGLILIGHLVFVGFFIIASILVRLTNLDPLVAYLTVGIPYGIYAIGIFFIAGFYLQNNSWQGHFSRGETALKKGKVEVALDFFQKALKLNDENPKIWQNYAFTLNQLKQHEDAIQAYQNAFKWNNKRKDSTWKSLTERSILIELAHVYRDLGNSQKALELVSELLKWNTRDGRIYRDIALFHNDLGQYQEAIDAANKSLEINKNDGRAFTYKGYAYLKLGEIEKARPLLEKAIKFDPFFARSYYNMAVFYNTLNQKEKALEFCEKSLQIDRNFTESLHLKEMLI